VTKTCMKQVEELYIGRPCGDPEPLHLPVVVLRG
jgi:hypothetical protein